MCMNTSFTCVHQIRRLTSAIRTQIHTHTTYLLLKFFVYSCWFIYRYIWVIRCKIVHEVLNQMYIFLKLLFSVYFSYIEIQNRGIYCDVMSHYAFISISKGCVALSVLRYIICKFTSLASTIYFLIKWNSNISSYWYRLNFFLKTCTENNKNRCII